MNPKVAQTHEQADHHMTPALGAGSFGALANLSGFFCNYVHGKLLPR
jgi:hypothetical protein